MKMTTRKFRQFCRDTGGDLAATESGLYACYLPDGEVQYDPEGEQFELNGHVRLTRIPEEAVGIDKDRTGDEMAFRPNVNVGTEELSKTHHSIGFRMG